MFPLDTPENIRKHLVFRCFQGDQKRILGRQGLIKTKIHLQVCYRKLLNFLKTVILENPFKIIF